VVQRAIGESEGGLYSRKIDLSFRWSMSWFIFSEVMFFGAFFTACGGRAPTRCRCWAAWRTRCCGPTSRPSGRAWPLAPRPRRPARGAVPDHGPVLAAAHHQHRAAADLGRDADHRPPCALLAGNRAKTIAFMWITVLLGATFLCVQGYEYCHAYSDLNLKLSSGVYGSTFFMLTGFHGFHVFVGMLMLLFITLRLMKGHFTPERHFGFEGAAWYWHFVDVVWLGLYILVYWM
jgi:cytochrome c oxidase subunit 3